MIRQVLAYTLFFPLTFKFVILVDFCKNRADGNWRNPWNCHDFITCHVERSFDRKCSVLATLNYDPYADRCEYPYEQKCINISKWINCLYLNFIVIVKCFIFSPCYHLYTLNVRKCEAADIFLHNTFLYVRCLCSKLWTIFC